MLLTGLDRRYWKHDARSALPAQIVQRIHQKEPPDRSVCRCLIKHRIRFARIIMAGVIGFRPEMIFLASNDLVIKKPKLKPKPKLMQKRRKSLRSYTSRFIR